MVVLNCFVICDCCLDVCMCGYYNVWCYDNCVGIFVTCVLVFTGFGIVYFMYIYSYLLLV